MRVGLLALSALFVWFAISTRNSDAQDQLTLRSMLAMAKIAGACGILDSQLHFHKTTKMDGGEAFVFRFWSTEAARLGQTLQEYSDKCNQAISGYDQLWQAAPN